ncbi:MAG TPA: hypothetical protein VFJ85_10590 [Acidimicrobiales bacterium]|nr:hypothetical protein [Acidimicrobiales bacterium]
MRRPHLPLGSAARGAVAGAVGTLAMDLVWYQRYRRGGGAQKFVPWELSTSVHGWEGAPAPALVGKRLFEAAFHREPPARLAAVTNDVVHWSMGVVSGAVYGVVAGSVHHRRFQSAVDSALGPVVWASGYAALPRLGIYKRIWDYGLRTLAQDLSAHTVYGGVTAGTFRTLTALSSK